MYNAQYNYIEIKNDQTILFLCVYLMMVITNIIIIISINKNDNQ